MKKMIPLLLCLAATPALAMDLLDTYRLALASDPAWRATLNTYLADQQNEGLAYGALLPNVGLSGTVIRNHFDSDVSSKNLSYNSKQAALSVRQPLFRPELWARYQQAKVSSNLNDAKLQVEQQNFIQKVAEAYFNVLRADATVEALQAEERALERQRTMMNERFKAGLIARTDVTESLAQYQNAVANRIAGEIAKTSAQEALAAILGQPVDTLSPLRDDIRYQAPYPADMDQWVALARQRNPQVDAARYAYAAALRNRDVQDAGRLPKLDFVGNATLNKQGLASQRSSDGKNLSAGLELSIPLYTGGQVGLSVRQASYQADAARNQIDAAERQVVAQARSSFLNLQADRSRLDARQEAVKSGETVAEASQVGYELGVRNIVDVLLAQRNAFAARRDYVNSRYDYVINVIRLRAAAGQLTANDLTEINQWLVPNAANPVSSTAVATGTALDQPTP
ncbi:MAG: hypothetical protein RLY58_1891 [Pseudomonadota bacterium]|jgi:outer membrane protein